jgi:hypothetical protein
VATTLSNFLVQTGGGLSGAAMSTGPVVRVADRQTASVLAARGPGGLANTGHQIVDRINTDLSTTGYARNGSAMLVLSGTTPVTIDLTDLTSATTSWGGDTTFAKWFMLIFSNIGQSGDITIKQGASNPANLLGISTTPAQTVPAGSALVLQSVAGVTVSATAKTITITPSNGGTFGLAVGGA